MNLPKIIIGIALFVNMVTILPNTIYANELIVMYKKGESPNDLERKISKRQYDARRSIWSEKKQNVTDFAIRFAKKNTPEMKLKRIIQTENQVGMVSKYAIVKDEQDLSDVFLIKLNGSRSTEYAASLFAIMPEVVYVEENILFNNTQ